MSYRDNAARITARAPNRSSPHQHVRLPGKLRMLRDALDAAGRPRTDFVVSAFPTDRLTLDQVRQRLEPIAAEINEPYRRGA
jgi:hypothetical protein